MLGLETVIGTIISIVAKNPEVALKCLKVFCDVAIGILKGMDALGPDSNIEELTDKAILAEQDGVRPKDFDSFEDYMKYIDEYEIDPEKAALITEDQRTQKTVELTTRFAKEIFKDFPMETFLPLACSNPGYFTAEKIKHISEAVAEDKVITGEDIIRYFKNQERKEDVFLKIENALIDIERKINPELSENEAWKNIRKVCSQQV